MTGAPALITGTRPDGSKLYAAIDGGAHHVEPGVRDMKLSAWLSPFRDVEAAKAALKAEGCAI